MRDSYSLYEAKARLSAIIRRVREGHRVVITLHGEPAAEIRPVECTSSGLEQRVMQMAERGIVVRPSDKPIPPHRVVRRSGALKQFLADRDG